MLTVKVKSIGRPYVMSPIDFEWLQGHLNEPLPVLSINFDTTGNLWSIAVYTPDNMVIGCISLFINEQNVKYELEGDIPWNS